jgi:hypothetical protein
MMTAWGTKMSYKPCKSNSERQRESGAANTAVKAWFSVLNSADKMDWFKNQKKMNEYGKR